MNNTTELLRKHGMGSFEEAASTRLAPVDGDSAQARSAQIPLDQIERTSWIGRHDPEMDRLGWQVATSRQNTSAFRVRNRHGGALSVYEADLRVERADGTEFLIEVKTEALISDDAGTALILFAEEDGVYSLKSHRDSAVDTNAISRYMALGTPSWLRALIEENLVTGDAYRATVAAGLYARLGPAPRSEELFGTQSHDPRVDQWIEDLGPFYRAAAERLAIRRIPHLQAIIRALAARPQHEKESWRRELTDAALLRDDLQSVSYLLHGLRESTSLNTALAHLDGEGEALVASLDQRLEIEDRRLAEAGALEVGEWWVELGPS